MVLELYFYGGCGFTFRGVMTLGHLGWDFFAIWDIMAT